MITIVDLVHFAVSLILSFAKFKMESPDSDISRYLPFTAGDHIMFKKAIENSTATGAIAKIDEFGVSWDEVIWRKEADVGLYVDFVRDQPPAGSNDANANAVLARALGKSGLHLVGYVCLLVTAPEVVDDNISPAPSALLFIRKIENCGGKMTARKMVACTALLEFSSGDCSQEIIVNFLPGCIVTSSAKGERELIDDSKAVWYTILDLEQLSPLPWAKFDNENWSMSSIAQYERQGTVKIKWIEEMATIPQMFIKMLDEQICTDLKITCSDNVDIHCHKCVLAVTNENLKELVENIEEGLDFGSLFGADSKTTMAFVRCIYTDVKDVAALEACFQVASAVLKIAVKYKMDRLVKICSRIIISKEDTWFDVPGLYALYGFIRLLTDYHEVMEDLKKKIMRTSGRLIAEKKRKRTHEADPAQTENDDLDGILDCEGPTDWKLFKEWFQDVVGEVVPDNVSQ